MELMNTIINKNKGRNISERPPFPLKLKIDVCDVCNHSCVFCPTAIQVREQSNIDDVLCRRIIKDAYDAGARELAISATGEPLINPLLEEYISFAKKIGFDYVFINTNGMLLKKARIQSLLDSGIDSVKISLNAGNAESYKLIHGVDCFNQVIENIILFNNLRDKEKTKLFVSYVAIKENLNQAESLRLQIEEYIDEFIVLHANTRGNASGSDCFSESLLGNDIYTFKYPCGQLFDTAVVLADGHLVICCQDFDKSTVVANLNDMSIVDAWNCEKFIRFREKYLARDLSSTLCNNCLFGRSEYVEPLSPQVKNYPINESSIKDRIKRMNTLAMEV